MYIGDMRHLVIIFTLICTVAVLKAQVIVNGGFEDWDTVGTSYEDPVGWKTSNNLSTAIAGLSVSKDTAAYADSFAVKISSYIGGFVPETYAGMITNGSIDFDSLGTDGDAINYKPARLSGYYKFSSVAADSGFVVLYLNRYSQTLNRDELVAGGSMALPPASDWTYFEIDIQNEFQNSPDPESFVVIATSTRDIGNPEESTLWLDGLEFSGILSVADPELVAEVKAYPNPASEVLIIDAGVNRFTTLQLFDASGAQLKSVRIDDKTTGQYQLNVGSLNEGVYFLHATSNDGRVWTHTFNVIR